MPRKAAVANRNDRRALFLKMIDDLKRERDDLVARVAELDSELAEYGAEGAPKKGPARTGKKAATKKPATRARKSAGRAPRSGSLKDYIVQVVGKSAMSPADIADAAVGAGYQSSSKTLAQSVSVACAQLVKSGQLVKEGRGSYRAA